MKKKRKWEIKTRIKRQNWERLCEFVNGLAEAGNGYDKQKKKIMKDVPVAVICYDILVGVTS